MTPRVQCARTGAWSQGGLQGACRVSCRVACPGAVYQGAYQEAYQAACLCTHTATVTARQSCSRRGGKHNIHTQAPATSKWYRLQPLSSTTRAWTSAQLRSYLGGPPGGIPWGMPGGIPLNHNQESAGGGRGYWRFLPSFFPFLPSFPCGTYPGSCGGLKKFHE